MIVSAAGAERQGRRIGARSLTVRKLSEANLHWNLCLPGGPLIAAFVELPRGKTGNKRSEIGSPDKCPFISSSFASVVTP
jgi:type II secretory pathway component PulL